MAPSVIHDVLQVLTAFPSGAVPHVPEGVPTVLRLGGKQ